MSRDPAFEPRSEGFIDQRRPNDGRDDFVQVGEALDRVGEGLLVDLGVFGPDAVAEGAIGDGGKFEVHDATPTLVKCYQHFILTLLNDVNRKCW